MHNISWILAEAQTFSTFNSKRYYEKLYSLPFAFFGIFSKSLIEDMLKTWTLLVWAMKCCKNQSCTIFSCCTIILFWSNSDSWSDFENLQQLMASYKHKKIFLYSKKYCIYSETKWHNLSPSNELQVTIYSLPDQKFTPINSPPRLPVGHQF